jgi:predicted amino acid-binding ACT domain protein
MGLNDILHVIALSHIQKSDFNTGQKSHNCRPALSNVLLACVKCAIVSNTVIESIFVFPLRIRCSKSVQNFPNPQKNLAETGQQHDATVHEIFFMVLVVKKRDECQSCSRTATSTRNKLHCWYKYLKKHIPGLFDVKSKCEL